LALAAGFFLLGGHEVFSLENIRAYHADAEALYRAHPILTLAGLFLLYVALTTVSLPGGAALTVLSGAVLGTPAAVVLISFASSIGATFAFLISRYVLRDWVCARFPKVAFISRGFEKEGAPYLFMLRLVPLFPFFLVNLGMGLTDIRVRTYYWVSQLGMLAGTALFASAGGRLATLESPYDVLSPSILALFVCIAVLPLAAKKLFSARRRV
jgi:uncharacterized membrane protein YdjX (TVP38/TMEM64 family)